MNSRMLWKKDRGLVNTSTLGLSFDVFCKIGRGGEIVKSILQWRERQFTTPYSTVFQGRRSEEEFTSTAGSSRKEPPPLRSLRPTTFSLSAVLYSADTTVRPSQCQRLNARPWPNQPRKRCQAPGQDVTRVSPSMHTSIAPADELLRSPWSSQVDARSSTTKLSGPGPNTGYALAPLWCRPECYR